MEGFCYAIGTDMQILYSMVGAMVRERERERRRRADAVTRSGVSSRLGLFD